MDRGASYGYVGDPCRTVFVAMFSIVIKLKDSWMSWTEI